MHFKAFEHVNFIYRINYYKSKMAYKRDGLMRLYVKYRSVLIDTDFIGCIGNPTTRYQTISKFI